MIYLMFVLALFAATATKICSKDTPGWTSRRSLPRNLYMDMDPWLE
jgi:hypothetical protein